MSRYRLLAIIGAFVLIPSCQRAPASAPSNNSASSQDSSMNAQDDVMNMSAGMPDEGRMGAGPTNSPGDGTGTSAPKERFISCPSDPRCRR
jgi:hypothetical protein